MTVDFSDNTALLHHLGSRYNTLQPNSKRSPVSTVEPRRSLDQLASMAANIFDGRVRLSLRPEDNGKFVAIDVDSGEYEIDSDDYASVARLRSRKPAAEIWLMRAGQPTTYRMGLAR